MKRVFFFSLSLLLHLQIVVFGLDIDHEIIKGKLENGFSYFIRKNSFPEKEARIKLIVRAGSLHEEEDQKGLAHFVEHMVFRGTRNFSETQIDQYLHSIGAKFGPDLNAATTYDLTTYEFTIPISSSSLETAVHILKEFAAHANMDTDMIDKERHVIMQEYNLRIKSTMGRLFEKISSTIYKGSGLFTCSPLGLPQIILHGQPERIRDFYQKWYTPDRMALVIVGDIDKETAEQAVKHHFSSLASQTEKEENEPCLQPIDNPNFLIQVNDPEMTNSIASMYQIIPYEEQEDISDVDAIYEGEKKEIACAILHKYLQEAGMQNNPPFLMADIEDFSIHPQYHHFGITGMCFEKRPLDTFRTFINIVRMLIEKGPSESVFQECLQSAKKQLEKEKHERLSHCELEEDIKNYFLYHTPMYTKASLQEEQGKALHVISLLEIHEWMKENLALDQWKFYLFTPTPLDLDETALYELLHHNRDSAKEHQEKTPTFVDEHEEKDLSLPIKKPHTVFFHTDIEKNKVSLALVAQGGLVDLDPTLVPAAYFAPNYLLHTGFGPMTHGKVFSFFSERNISLWTKISSNYHSIHVSGPKDQSLQMIEALKWALTEKNFSEEAWKIFKEKVAELELHQKRDPDYRVGTKMHELIYGSSPAFQTPSVTEVRYPDVVKVLRKYFSPSEDFTLFVTGNFDESTLEEAIDQHLQLPTPRTQTKPEIDVEAAARQFPSTSYELTMHEGIEDICQQNFSYSCMLPDTKPCELVALTNIVSQRLLQKLRKENGKIYHVHFTYDLPFEYRTDRVIFYGHFGCDPEDHDFLKNLTMRELETFSQEGPTEEELSFQKKSLTRQQRERFAYIEAWEEKMIKEHFGYETHLLFEDDLEFLDQFLTQERQKKLAQKIFCQSPHFWITRVQEK